MAVTPHSKKDTAEEWSELESDPGLFTLLVKEFGVKDVKVEEVYDITSKIPNEVFGYVFLFRYEHGGDRRGRKKARDVAAEGASYVQDTEVVRKMFYAQQIVVNSCATHALLSVLLNCPHLELGPSLSRLKAMSAGMDPETKGFAIANMAELATAHNKFAKPTVALPQVGRLKNEVLSSSVQSLMPETFHFVSFVPIEGRLFELDGLKDHPIDHGPWGEQEDWTDLFKRVISGRLTQSENFLFNLLAVVPDPITRESQHLKSLCKEQKELLSNTLGLVNKNVSSKEQQGRGSQEGKWDAVQKIARSMSSAGESTKDKVAAISRGLLEDHIAQVIRIDGEIKSSKQRLKEHLDVAQLYEVEHARRVYDYEPFINKFIKVLAQNNKLPQRIMKSTIVKTVNSGHINRKHKRRVIGCNPKQKTSPLVNGNQMDWQ